MTEKVNVLLVDDSDADNLIHRYVLEDVKEVNEIIEFNYAESALAYLKTPSRLPVHIIFLDINMPRMDGFEFLDEYHTLYPELKANTAIFLLTTSLNPADSACVEANPEVRGFINKPLTLEHVSELIKAYCRDVASDTLKQAGATYL